MKNYLFNVDKVSRMDMIGLVKQDNLDPTNTQSGILHIFGKFGLLAMDVLLPPMAR